ncbi:hypothetical protein FNF29_08390 [Cafeteria roenbergensis]|uniref:Uncharacterized protein n=1 Tax=Cafeteria roenbergensis TaxID=33653 RepID=A0A5A8C1N2_CAFRO|nr:hypothetical protein FNF29_08390 [Cafeteria roenbergensis]|eukprot:KAA0145791.1 hypothetical protein FNF29_08390 [Cafeteria roenbergensis]
MVQDNSASAAPAALRGVNSRVDTSFLEFPKVPSAAELCQLVADMADKHGGPFFLAPMDIQAAYRQLSAGAGATPLLTIASGKVTLMNVALPMGGHRGALVEAGYEVSFDGCELFLRDCAACVAQARAATDGRPGGRATRLLSVLDRDGNSHVFAAMLALTDVRTGRPTVVAAVRAWRALCAAKGARFPRSGRITLAAASIFARALMAGDTELSPSSLVSYLFAVRRFARFAFDEADDPMSDKHSAIKLIVARMNLLT